MSDRADRTFTNQTHIADAYSRQEAGLSSETKARLKQPALDLSSDRQLDHVLRL